MWTYLACSTDLTSSPESEESPLPWLPGSDQLPIVRSTDTVRRSYFLKWQRAHYQSRPYGTMCVHSAQSMSPESALAIQELARAAITAMTENLSISLQEVFRARTSALQDMEQAWQASEAVFSGKSYGSVANWDPDLSSWKTCQQSLITEARKWSEPLPPWGMTVDGALYPLRMSAPTISGKDGFYWPTPSQLKGKHGWNLATAINFWPTPRAQDGKHGAITPTEATRKRLISGQANLPEAVVESSRKFFATPAARDYRYPNSQESQERRNTYSSRGQQLPNQIGGPLNPQWVEWLMGYPAGWTVLPDWVMQWYRSKRGRRSKSLPDCEV